MSLHMSSHFRLRSALICVAAALLPFGAQAIEPSQFYAGAVDKQPLSVPRPDALKKTN